MVFDELMVKPGKKFNLKKFDTNYTGKYKKNKEKAVEDLQKYLIKLPDIQYKMYADNRYAILIDLQGIDAAGKDGTLRKVISALNPHGARTWNFKKPSDEEMDHEYLWRIHPKVPNYGDIGVFNRSYYEDVLITKVKHFISDDVCEQRYRQINDFERYLYENRFRILKFFLFISKKEQEKRFLDRLLDPTKNWKFSSNDLVERNHWDDYLKAFEDMLNATSTKYAPWYVIPADNKWFRNLAVAALLYETMADLDLKWPEPSKETLELVKTAKRTGKLPQVAAKK